MGTLQPQDGRVTWGGQSSVPGQVDVDLMPPGAQGARERVDDVRQAAGLGQRLTFRGQHRDAHRVDGTRSVVDAVRQPVPGSGLV